MSITTSVQVCFQVAVDPDFEELRVLDELMEDADWDEQTPATCTACGWRGAVAALRPARMQVSSPA